MQVTAALAYASKLSWAVLPIAPGSKRPLTPRGVHDASRDRLAIKRLWAESPEAGIAVAAGESGLLVLDCDPRSGGNESLLQLPELPKCPTQLSGGGGRHFVFSYSGKPLKGKLAPGLDLLYLGKYFITSPTKHPSGNSYAWDKTRHPLDIEAPPAPDWLLQAAQIQEVSQGNNFALAGPESELRARAYLAKIPGAVSGNGGHVHTFCTAQKLVRHFGLDANTALTLLREWNLRCSPPWSEWQLKHKIQQAISRGRLQPK